MRDEALRGAVAKIARQITGALLAALVLLGGCATAPPLAPVTAPLGDPARIADFAFSGRLAVREGERGHYGNVRWTTHAGATEVLLASPLGQAVARLEAAPGNYRLTTSDGRVYRAANADGLTEQALGYRLPVEGLRWWLFARAAPGVAVPPRNGTDGLPEALEQAGWSIRFANYVQAGGVAVPGRVVLVRGDLEIRLVVDQWEIAAR